MKIDVSVPEVVEICKVMQIQPEPLFDLIRANIRQSVGQYLSEVIQVELTQCLGRESDERTGEPANHRHGSYGRQVTLKAIGRVEVQVPRDRQGAFETPVIPPSQA